MVKGTEDLLATLTVSSAAGSAAVKETNSSSWSGRPRTGSRRPSHVRGLVDSYVVSLAAPFRALISHFRYLCGCRPAPSPAVAAQVPGDVVLDLSEMTIQTIKLGTGLRQVKPFTMESGNRYPSRDLGVRV